MGTLDFIIWNGSPEIFSVGSFALRWYGLFFALGFLLSQQIMYYIYRKEGKPEKDIDTLTIYMVVATILGARLGHVIFYQPEILWESPWSVLLPFEFSPFRFTGLQGLASHGGAIGILFALWLYARKNRPNQSYLQVLDRIVIVVALTGALIRMGNYFNSEIIGLPTEKPWGVVFVSRLTESIKNDRVDRDQIVESIAYHKNDSMQVKPDGRIPLNIYLFFKPGVTEIQANNFVNFTVRNMLNSTYYEHFDAYGDNTTINFTPQDNGALAARIQTFGIARHPAQLYESIACVILFLLLFWLWYRQGDKLPAGRLFGIFLIWCFGLRILFEVFKENQEEFENTMALNMGQILSIPLVLAGICILIWSFRKNQVSST